MYGCIRMLVPFPGALFWYIGLDIRLQLDGICAQLPFACSFDVAGWAARIASFSVCYAYGPYLSLWVESTQVTSTNGWPTTAGCLESVCSIVTMVVVLDKHAAVIVGVVFSTRVTSVYCHTAPVRSLFLRHVGTIYGI